MKIEWTLRTVNVADIIPLPHNPRQIKSYDYEKLRESLDKFGLIDKLICNADLTLIGGHQRLCLLKDAGEKKTDVWLPQRLLEPDEVNELCVRLNRNHGEFDFDLLANEFDVSDLLDWGFHADELGIDIEEKPLKPQKYKIEIEFVSMRDLDDATNKIQELMQDFENMKMKVKI